MADVDTTFTPLQITALSERVHREEEAPEEQPVRDRDALYDILYETCPRMRGGGG